MSAHNDAAFLRMFLLILGALVAFTIIVMFAASMVSSEMDGRRANDSHAQAATAERIKPVGKVEIAKADTAGVAPAAPKTATAETTQAAPTEETPPATTEAPAAAGSAGKTTYDTACMACHASGVANAPKLGDKAAWAERIAQGMETMVANAINGKGGMPPKGGRLDLSDDVVKAAVIYMVEESK